MEGPLPTNNLEYALLTRILLDRDFHNVEKLQITEDYFSIPEVREIFRYIKDTFHNPQTLGLTPSVDMVSSRFRGFYTVPANDPVPLLCNELRRNKLQIDMLNLAGSLYQEAQADPMAALATLKAQVPRLTSMQDVGQDLSMSAAFNLIRDRYNTVQMSGGIIGIPYPWQPLNDATQGMQDGQYIVIFGRPKSMKSWVATKIACHAYLRARRRVLYYTREMEPLEIADRMACVIAEVDYDLFENGQLQPVMADRVWAILGDLIQDERAAGAAGMHQPFLTIISDRSMGTDGGGVSWLQAKIRETRPDLVVVDGLYLMKDDRTGKREVDWKVITNISRDLKLTAQQFHIPLIGVTQATRKAEGTMGQDTTEAAFADAIAQDCDAMYRTISPKGNNPDTGRHELYIAATAQRKGKFEGMWIQGEPATSFSYLRPAQAGDDIKYGEPPAPGQHYNRQQQGSVGAPRMVRRSQAPTDPVTGNWNKSGGR